MATITIDGKSNTYFYLFDGVKAGSNPIQFIRL